MTSTNQSQEQDSRTTFFHQSGWLALATSSGGFFMVATQVVANRWMEPAEYGIWFTLLRIYLLMSIPSVGLQVIFARQAAAAVSDAEQARLAAATRATLAATLVLWVVMAAVALIWQDHWLRVLKIVHPAALWATVVIGLASLWSPVVRGLLQGVQNFLGLGWVLILDGVGRFCAILVILVLGGQSVGGMTGALIGQVVSLGAGFAWLASLLRHRGATMDWRPWLRRVIPLTLGFAGIQLMSTLDVVYVRG